jgi:hypothetical protein
MVNPKANCKIEIYDTDGNLTQTITDDIKECHTKEIMTSGIGSFSFTLPAFKNFNVVYDDIGNNYTAKIFFGYNGSYTHKFTGRILPWTTVIAEDGWRMFEGKCLGEILERRFKYNKRWQAVEADDIVAEIASDLGLSSNIDLITDPETVTVRTSSYFDLLKQISDYWVDAGTQIQMDFNIDKDNTLQWTNRPRRTGAGLETLVYGEAFQSYTLKYDIQPVKNKIIVYGAAKAPYPVTKDGWTDALTNWAVTTGTLSLADAPATAPNTPKAGTYWIKCDVNVTTKIGAFYRTIPRVYLRDINKLCFWHWLSSSTADTAQVQLYAPDEYNTFYSKIGALATGGVNWNDLSLGEGAEYDIDENPSGIWEKFGSPNWMDINAVGFLFHDAGGGVGDLDIYIDKLYFYPERWSAIAEDTVTSQPAYELREVEYTDDNLLSEDECLVRAETLLYQQKDRLMRLDFSVAGNINILLGDRFTLDLPPDNISAMDFDVVSVENHYSLDTGYQTVTHCIGGSVSRQLPALTTLDSIQRQITQNRDITAELYSRIVR